MDTITKHLEEAIGFLFNIKKIEPPLAIEKTKKDFDGDFTFVVFPYIKHFKCNPKEAAEKIGTYCCKHYPIFHSFNVIQGFLNLSMSDDYWLDIFNKDIVNEDFIKKTENKKSIIVEFSSPNTNKPLHLGHLRNIFLGDSVAKILDANGYHTPKVQIINDRGIHICKSIVAWQKFGNEETPSSTNTKGDHFVGKYYVMFDKAYKKEVKELMDKGVSKDEALQLSPIMVEAREVLQKWEAKDPKVIELWKTMNNWVYDGFDKTYNTLDIKFDKSYYESNTYLSGKKEVLNGLKKNHFYREEDGSIWVDLTTSGLDKKLLLRSDGTSVYMTQDIGTAIQRFNDYPKTIKQIYTVGNEQEYHFKVLFLILQKLGYSWARENYHLSYGMVDLPDGKMKSREGTVVDADKLYEEMIQIAKERTQELGKIEGFDEKEAEELYHIIGIGALKYFLLKVDPAKNMLFNPNTSIDFHGNTAPFIQYTYARIASIIRRAKSDNIHIKGYLKPKHVLKPSEKNNISILSDWNNKFQEATNLYSPAIITSYVYDLAKAFSHLYSDVSILHDPDSETVAFRVMLARETGRYIKHCFSLLGIEVPNRM